jgi:hypothetical protein
MHDALRDAGIEAALPRVRVVGKEGR